MTSEYKKKFQKCLNQIQLGYSHINKWFYNKDQFWAEEFWTNSITNKYGENWYLDWDEFFYKEHFRNPNQPVMYPIYSITYDPDNGPYIQLLGKKLKIFVEYSCKKDIISSQQLVQKYLTYIKKNVTNNMNYKHEYHENNYKWKS